MANLSIRNLTINPLELTTIERFQGQRASSGFLGSSDKLITPQGDALKKDNVSVRVEPFHVTHTGVRTPDPGREVLRLTFRTGEHQYQTDVPSASARSAVLRKMDGGPHELTAVYIPTGALLAVFSSSKLNAWMHELHDEWPLPLLSIPGTHNSPTCYKALPSVRCQAVGVPEQLRNGVRFLDVRVSVSSGDDSLTLVHSVFPVSLTGSKYFAHMLEEIYTFLDDNPSETILMSVKREGTGRGTDGDLGKYLYRSYVEKNRDRWWTEPKIPMLGPARGRIVLIRRFGLNEDMEGYWDGRGWGIDAERWPDNCEDGTVGGGHFHIQDFYEISESQNIQKKIEFTRGHLERAAQQSFFLTGLAAGGRDPHLPPFYVNFLSASNFFHPTCWPEKIATKVNPAVIEYLCMRHGEEGKGPEKLKVGSAATGIVVTDWVGLGDDWDLIRCIVGMNARLQLKKRMC